MSETVLFPTGGTPRRPIPRSPAASTTPRWLPWAIGVQAVVVVGLIAGGFWWMRGPTPGPTPPSPVADYDPAFVPIGRDVAKAFAKDFAESYETGTKLWAAGQSRQAAADTASHEFSAARQKSFDTLASPALGKVIDPGKAEAEITPDERARLTRARRGISKGATP